MPRLAMPREFYIPKDAAKVDVGVEDLAVYFYQHTADSGQVRVYALGFHGKAAKPDFHHRYSSPQARQEAVDRYVEGQKLHAATKAQRHADRQKPHPLTLGQILYTSWGYDQTNIDFYEVTKVVGDRTVEIRKVSQALAENQPGQPHADYVVPVPGSYVDDPMVKHPDPSGNIRIASYASAHPWGGTPKSQTGFGYGH